MTNTPAAPAVDRPRMQAAFHAALDRRGILYDQLDADGIGFGLHTDGSVGLFEDGHAEPLVTVPLWKVMAVEAEDVWPFVTEALEGRFAPIRDRLEAAIRAGRFEVTDSGEFVFVAADDLDIVAVHRSRFLEAWLARFGKATR